MEIYTKLLAVQAKLNAPKNQRNNFGNYNYRSAEDILEAVKPLLQEVGATIIISDNIENVGGKNYVRATATFISGNEQTSVSAYAREEESKKGMDASQITGSTSSYARKYALNGLLLIDDNKDSDTTNTHGKEQNNAFKSVFKSTKQKPVQKQASSSTEEANRKLTIDEYSKLVHWCNAKKAGAFEYATKQLGIGGEKVFLSDKENIIKAVKEFAKE